MTRSDDLHESAVRDSPRQTMANPLLFGTRQRRTVAKVESQGGPRADLVDVLPSRSAATRKSEGDSLRANPLT